MAASCHSLTEYLQPSNKRPTTSEDSEERLPHKIREEPDSGSEWSGSEDDEADDDDDDVSLPKFDHFLRRNIRGRQLGRVLSEFW